MIYRKVSNNDRGYYQGFTKFLPEFTSKMCLLIEVRLLFRSGEVNDLMCLFKGPDSENDRPQLSQGNLF